MIRPALARYAQAEGLLGAARAYFYETYDEIWRKGTAGQSFTLKDHALARLGSVTPVKLAVQAVDLVADAAGMNATHAGTPIERAWRDVHTAAQHVGSTLRASRSSAVSSSGSTPARP